MPAFRYQALDANQEIVAGTVQADAVQQAIAQLEAEGLTVQSISLDTIEPETQTQKPRAVTPESPTPDAAVEQAVIQEHLAKVLDKGRSIVPALRAYADEMPAGRGRRQLREACRILEQGNVVEAAGAFSTLSEYWIPLLSSAAASNNPGLVLREFLNESRRAEELHRQWRRTLAYPAVVLLIALAVFAALCVFIIPAFREIFEDFELQLPLITMWTLKVAEFVASPSALAAAIVTSIAIVVLVAGRRWLPRPIRWLGNRFGAMVGGSTAVAQFARFTADLLEAGVELPRALRIAGYATRRPAFRAAGWRLAREVQAGGEIDIEEYRRPLSATVVHALRMDAPTASRVRLLKEVSSCHGDRVRHQLSWTHGLIEPALICAVAIVIGVIVLALFVPLVDLINNLSN
jgi:type IV pilus assembly protein PilC